MQYNPVIIIPGIGQSKVDLLDQNGNKIKSAWPFQLDEKVLLNELKGSLMKMMIFKKDGGFSDKVAGIVNDIADPLASNPDGTEKHNKKAVKYDRPVSECSEDEKRYIYKMVPLEQLGEKIGEDKLFFFSFDPFGDLFDTAAELDKFVSYVKEKTGSEKVDLISISIGGTVLRAYLMGYGEKGDIEKVLNIVSALDGTELIADIFEDKLSLDDPAALLSAAGGKAASLASMIGMIPQEVVNNVITKSLDVIKNAVLYNCTTMWAAIPNSRFDAVYLLRKKSGIDPVLDAKIKAFYSFTCDFKNKAKSLCEKGMKFFQICGFGNKMIPVTASANISSDRIVDIHSSSLGITQCAYDEEPDIASASFPKTTWLFRKQFHSDIAYNDVALSLAAKIITGEITDVSSDPAYPQINGTRDIKKLKYNLIPKAKELIETVSDDAIKAELSDCVAEYEDMLKNTIVENNDQVKAFENKLSDITARAEN